MKSLFGILRSLGLVVQPDLPGICERRTSLETTGSPPPAYGWGSGSPDDRSSSIVIGAGTAPPNGGVLGAEVAEDGSILLQEPVSRRSRLRFATPHRWIARLGRQIIRLSLLRVLSH